MRFYSRFAERPFCVWADYQAICRDGLESFRMETIIDTCNYVAPPKMAAIVAMDRLRIQQLLGATDDRVMHYEHRHPMMEQEAVADIHFHEITLADELLQYDDDEPARQEIVAEQQYLSHLTWFVLACGDTDPFAVHGAQMQDVRRRWGVLALGTGLPRELIEKVVAAPRLEDVMDAD